MVHATAAQNVVCGDCTTDDCRSILLSETLEQLSVEPFQVEMQTDTVPQIGKSNISKTA